MSYFGIVVQISLLATLAIITVRELYYGTRMLRIACKHSPYAPQTEMRILLKPKEMFGRAMDILLISGTAMIFNLWLLAVGYAVLRSIEYLSMLIICQYWHRYHSRCCFYA